MKNSDALAHYNILPEAEIKGLDNAIGEIGHVEDKEHAVSNLVDNSHVQVKSESSEKFAEGDDDEDSTAE